MSREKGIRRTATGWQAYGRAEGLFFSKRFPPETSLGEMKEWRRQERVRIELGLKQSAQAEALQPPPAFRDDAKRYLEAVRAMPTWKTRKRHIEEWVELFRERPRSSIAAVEIRAQRDRWLTSGPRMEQRKVQGRFRWVRVSKPLSASSVNQRLRALRNLWTVLDGRHAPNPIADVPEAEEPADVPRAIPATVIRAILDAIPDRGRPPRRVDGRPRLRPTLSKTKARLEVMAWTGLTPAQIGQIEQKDLDLAGKRVYVKRRRKGRGVAASWRPLTTQGVRAFKALIAAEAWGPYSSSSARRTFRWAAAKVQRHLAEAGVQVDLSDVTPYDLRHSVATDTLRATADLPATAALLGHADLRTTTRYAAAAIPEYLAAAARKLESMQRKGAREKLPQTDHDGVAQVVERLYEFQRSVRIERGMPGVRETYRSLFRPTPPDIQARLDAVFGIDKGAGRTVPPVAGIEVRPLLEQIERHAATLASASVSFGSPQSSRAKADAHAREIAAGGANHVLNIYTGVQYLRHIEGEKHLIYVSPGGVLLPALEDDAGLAGLGSDARVAIHVIQTGGLPKGGLGLLSLEPSMASKHVAELTGGQAFSAQYPDRALATIDEVTRVGYVLGYYPADTNFDGNSRRIDVRVRRAPGATVLFRHTYVASVEPRTYDHRTFIVQDRIMAAAEYDRAVEDIRVVLDGRRSGKSVTASIVVDATQVSLVTEGDSRRGRLDVAVFCTDGRERLLGQVWQKIDLALSPATYDRLLTDGIRHSAEIPVTGPPVWLKAVVYDYEADRVGSAIVRVR